jgi:threonine/homoserine/homoserine lactone efflux protein
MVALTNPKSILFFSALFPQFVTADVPMVVQYFVLTTIFTVCALTSHAFYVMLVHVLKGRLGNPAHARFVNRTCGALFVMLGLSLLRLRSKAG